jgi:hypothetical protein
MARFRDPKFVGRSWVIPEATADQVDEAMASRALETECPNCRVTSEVTCDFKCAACGAGRIEAIGLDAEGKGVVYWADIWCEAEIHADLVDGPDNLPTLLRFAVYRVEAWGGPGDNSYLIPNHRGNDLSQQTTDRSKAGILMRGEVKQDGCSNVQYRPDEGQHHEHYCTRETAMATGVAMGRLYDIMAILQKKA